MYLTMGDLAPIFGRRTSADEIRRELLRRQAAKANARLWLDNRRAQLKSQRRYGFISGVG
jgi:hypothetical protein